MATRKRAIPPAERVKQDQIDDRVRRARSTYTTIDDIYFAKCAELARDVGADPGDVIDEFTERAGAREFCSNDSRSEAERLAFIDTVERYARQRRTA